MKNSSHQIAALSNRIDQRFDVIDKQFKAVDKQFDDMRKDYKVLSDIIKDLDYKWEERLSELKAGQTKLEAGQDELRAEMARLRRSLFHESGSRETANENSTATSTAACASSRQSSQTWRSRQRKNKGIASTEDQRMLLYRFYGASMDGNYFCVQSAQQATAAVGGTTFVFHQPHSQTQRRSTTPLTEHVEPSTSQIVPS
jgi:hypothetical protein